MRMSAFPDEKPLATLCIGWLLLFPLLYFVVRGTPSYEHQEDVNGTSAQYGYFTAGGGGSNAKTRAEMIFIYAVAVAAMYPYSSKIWGASMRNKVLLSLPLLSVLSVFWSQAPSRTLLFSSSVVVLTLFPIFLVERFSQRRQIELILFAGVAAMVLSYLLIVLVPSLGISSGAGMLRPWNGLFSHKNHLGIIMTYLVLTALYWNPSTRMTRLAKPAIMFLATVLVIMSQSRTGWLLLAGGLAVAIVLKYYRRFSGIERFAISMSLITLALLVTIGAVVYAGKIGVLLGKDATLNGRTGIWAGILPSAMKRPLLGYGYDAFWLGFEGESGTFMFSTDHLGLGNAENAVLQLWLELGLVGVGLLFWILFRSCRNGLLCLRYKPTDPYVSWCVVMVFLTLFTLVDGDKIMYRHTIEWVVYVMAYVGLSDGARQIRMQGPA